MPKVKTRKIVKNRFRLTKNGKLIRRVQGRRHLRRKKSSGRKRRQDKSEVVTNTKYTRKITQLIRT